MGAQRSITAKQARKRSFTAARAACGVALGAVVVGQISVHPITAAARGARAVRTHWTAPRTAWGEPDLQGTWTSDDMIGVPFERPRRYGTRRFLTDEEFDARQKDNLLIASSVQAGVTPKAGFWIGHEGVDAQPYSSNWAEYSRHTSRQTSLIIDPEDGNFPPLTELGMLRRVSEIAAVRARSRPESWEDINMNARCISRGVLGSTLPGLYGNGTDILQSPGLVVIRYEMIHETRLIPIDPPGHPGPHLPAAIRTYMGNPRGHWEGDTLVVETTNFIGDWVGIGPMGDGIKYSDALRLVERFRRVSENTIEYTAIVNDPRIFTAPWTLEFPITHEPGYRIFEYACHEGNYAMADMLRGARAEERSETQAKAAATPR